MAVLKAEEEMKSLDLGDKRLTARATQLMRRIEERPDASFPDMLEERELEAHYRLTNNPAVSPGALLAPHLRETWKRAEGPGAVIVVHDSSEFAFGGERPREGLAHKGKKSVMMGHFTLCVGESPTPVVHGVVVSQFYVVKGGVWQAVSPEDHSTLPIPDGTARWFDAVQVARASAGEGRQLIHVMDREADDYPLLEALCATGDHFVVRACHNRCTVDPPGRVEPLLKAAEFIAERQVKLSRRGYRRPPDELKRHPPREERRARLAIRCCAASIKKPTSSPKDCAKKLALSFVEVVEIEPPEGEAPVHWRLMTSLPIVTQDDAERVVDIYRKRWLIEEYFKALKTGCSAEDRQAESRRALLNTIAMLIPVAVRILQLREASRQEPNAIAIGLVDAVELQALRCLAPREKLDDKPTNRQLLRAIARVGGHLKSNGEPGWLVILRGFQKLLAFAAGWRAAMAIRDS